MLDFSNELEILKTELKTTEDELRTLQTRLGQLPNIDGMKTQLSYLKDPKKRTMTKGASKVPRAKKVPGKKQTRRKKPEMIAFRAQIKAAVEVIGRRGKVFGAKNVLNTLKTQGHHGDARDAQIVRGHLKTLTKNGVLISPARGKYQLA